MIFNLFGKRYLIVFPFQKLRLYKPIEGVLELLWIMKFGELILPKEAIIKIFSNKLRVSGGKKPISSAV